MRLQRDRKAPSKTLLMNYKSLLTTVVASVAMTGFAHATDGYFDSNGTLIHYVTAGQGEAVVLVHGWMGDSTMWGKKDLFGNVKLDTTGMTGFEFIALDCRGHGKSDKPHDPNKYGIEMAEDVIRLLDHLKIKKAHLIGYSMGAFIVGNIAANHPDRVLSVIYGGQAPIIVGAKSSGSNEVEVFAKAVDEGKGLGPYLVYVSPPDRKPTLEQANAIAKALYGDKDVKAFALAGLSLGDLRVAPKSLSKCHAPALFIYGGNESNYVKDSVEAARKVIGNAEVKVIKDSNHVTTLTRPEFAATIVQFLLAHKSSKGREG